MFDVVRESVRQLERQTEGFLQRGDKEVLFKQSMLTLQANVLLLTNIIHPKQKQ